MAARSHGDGRETPTSPPSCLDVASRFATPGSTVGPVAGAGFDRHAGKSAVWFGAIEGMIMSRPEPHRHRARRRTGIVVTDRQLAE